MLASIHPHVLCPVCRQLISAQSEVCGQCRFPREGIAPGDPDAAAVVAEARELFGRVDPPAGYVSLRSTGERCVRSYFEALSRKDWAGAFGMLSVFARGRTALVPEIPGFRALRAALPMSSPPDVKRYWRKIIYGDFGHFQSVKRVSVVPRGAAGEMEAHLVVLDVHTVAFWRYLMIGLFAESASVFRLAFESVTVKHGDQHWMLTGEICSAADRRVGVLLRQAVR